MKFANATKPDRKPGVDGGGICDFFSGHPAESRTVDLIGRRVPHHCLAGLSIGAPVLSVG